MTILRQTLFFMFAICITHFGMFWIFIQGFFLSKNELSINNQCNKTPLNGNINDYINIFNNTYNNNNNNNNICWYTTREYDKIIIFLIDALKFEFVEPNDNNELNKLNYINKFKSISNLIKNEGNHVSTLLQY